MLVGWLVASLLACLLAPRADLLNFLYTRVEQTHTLTHSYTPVIFSDLNNFMYVFVARNCFEVCHPRSVFKL